MKEAEIKRLIDWVIRVLIFPNILISIFLISVTYSQQGDTDPYFISGVSKYLEGEYQEAIPLLEKAYQDNKKNEKIKDFLLKTLLETGIICVTRTDYQNAIYYFEKSLKINPKDKKLRTMNRKVQVMIAEEAEPTRNLKHGTDAEQRSLNSSGEVSSPVVIERDEVPKQSQMTEKEKKEKMSQHFIKATDLFQQQKYSEAIKEWDEVLKLDPNHQQSKEMIEKTKKQKIENRK